MKALWLERGPLRLVASRCGPFPRALEPLASGGELDVQALIDDRYPLQKGVEAFEKIRQPGVL